MNNEPAISQVTIYLRDVKECGENGDWWCVNGAVRFGMWYNELTFIEWGYTGRCALIRRAIFTDDRKPVMTHAFQINSASCELYRKERQNAIRIHEGWAYLEI